MIHNVLRHIGGFFRAIGTFIASHAKPFIALGCVLALVAVLGTIAFSQARTASAKNETPPETAKLTRDTITQSISVSGVVKSEKSTNVYSNQTYPIKEILVKVGDRVKVGDVLAQLDMSRLENDLAQAEVNYESTQTQAKEEVRNNNNSVTNAKTALEAQQIALSRQQLATKNAESDLRDAQEKRAEPFESYTYDKTIEDSRLAVERRRADLIDAEEDLRVAVYDFDDYTYRNAVADARTKLDRAITDLNNAGSDLDKEVYTPPDSFDSYTYETGISDAQRTYQRKQEDYATAQSAIDSATKAYNAIKDDPTTDAKTLAEAKAAVDSATTGLTTASRALEDAAIAVDKANIDMARAQDSYSKSTYDSKSTSVDTAAKSYDTARGAVNDAQNAYDRAQIDLQRAQSDAIDAATIAVNKAQQAVVDAELAYEKALKDKEQAIKDYMEGNDDKVEAAEKSLADTRKQLQTAQNSVKSAQQSLSQAQSKPATSGYNVELQELSLEQIEKNLAEGKIVATANGMITELNAKEGATPTGILFVIDDVDHLYASANIKEYNLASVKLDQATAVTTDATGDAVYDASISFISPKAVSEAGSTSVEFEVRAALKKPDDAIKIGMNAFLNIVTGTKSDVFVVPQSMIVTNERGSFVYAYAEGTQQEIPVTVGMTTSANAEISGEGLAEGMDLVLDPAGATSTGSSMPGGMFFGGGNR